MWNTTGRFSIEFQIAGTDTFDRHQMLNTDSAELAQFGFSETVDGIKRLGDLTDMVAVRLFDSESQQTVTQWVAS